jgi:hypothetical protein
MQTAVLLGGLQGSKERRGNWKYRENLLTREASYMVFGRRRITDRATRSGPAYENRQRTKPPWLSSRAFGDPPAQGFRGRPGLPVVLPDVFDLGAARAAPQDDFRAIADQHHGRNLTTNSALRRPDIRDTIRNHERRPEQCPDCQLPRHQGPIHQRLERRRQEARLKAQNRRGLPCGLPCRLAGARITGVARDRIV